MNTQFPSMLHWLENAFSDFLRSGRERRFTLKTAVSMLKLHRHFERLAPFMARTDIYTEVVMAHLGCTRSEALEILERAESSYATWPTQRELTFCDVVHYVSFNEFTKINNHQSWTQSDLTPLVASVVPKSFCVHNPIR